MSLANTASRDLPPWRVLLRRLNIFGFTGRSFVILAPAAWLTLFFLIPLAVVFKISLSEAAGWLTSRIRARTRRRLR